MSKTYEELAGAAGRARFFRPERYSADELFAGAPPRVWFEDKEYSLENISATGIGCLTRDFQPDETVLGDDTRGVLRLTQRGREIFRARARMARTAPSRGVLTVGLALDRGGFELDELVRKNAGALAASYGETFVGRPSRLAEPSQEYKSHCADILAFCGRYLDHIDTHFTPIADKLDDNAQNEIISEIAHGAAAEGQPGHLEAGAAEDRHLHRVRPSGWRPVAHRA